MKNKHLFFLFSILLSILLSTRLTTVFSKDPQHDEAWLVEKAARIREKARKLAEAEKAYFEEFPASFGVFNDLFGYRYEGEWGGRL